MTIAKLSTDTVAIVTIDWENRIHLWTLDTFREEVSLRKATRIPYYDGSGLQAKLAIRNDLLAEVFVYGAMYY